MTKNIPMSRGEVLWRALVIFGDIVKNRSRKEMVQKLIKKIDEEKRSIRKSQR